MPSAIAVPCRYPGGCSEKAQYRGYCAAHAQWRDQMRGNSGERLYGARWQKFRAWFIARRPICEDCGRAATAEVHHLEKVRDRPDLRLVESNCRGLCKPCHSVRTQRGE